MAIEKISTVSTFNKENAYNQNPKKILNNKAQEVFTEENKQISKKNSKEIKKTIENLNEKYKNTTCMFDVHEGTNHTIVKIIDKKTKEVIKEYPAEQILDQIEKGLEIAGIIFDKKS